MIKKYSYYFVVVLLIFSCSIKVFAQRTHKTTGNTIIKFKPPAVKVYLGNLTGKAALTAAMPGKTLITLPLKIVDDKNLNYPLVSYQFAYYRVGITEDEETGKTSPAKDMVSDHFNISPLPAIWQSNITETLHTGESLYFFDIIVMDKLGRRFFAPELKVTIE